MSEYYIRMLLVFEEVPYEFESWRQATVLLRAGPLCRIVWQYTVSVSIRRGNVNTDDGSDVKPFVVA